MGVPAFFRWLSRKYPSVIVECIEQRVSNITYKLHYKTISLVKNLFILLNDYYNTVLISEPILFLYILI